MDTAIKLTKAERLELNQRATSRSGRAEDARRARLVLFLQEGLSWAMSRSVLNGEAVAAPGFHCCQTH